MFGASSGLAQKTWDGGGTTTNFSDGLNWTDDTPATTNTTYTFAGTTGLTANNDITLTGADNTIIFDATAGAFTLTGNPIRGGSITNSSSSQQTISLNMRYNGGRTIDTGSAGILLTVFPTSTGGGRTLTKNGSGDLTITATGTNSNISYSVAAGRLVFANTSGTATLNGIVSGAGRVVKSAAGSVTLAGANTYSGGTDVEAGVLTFSQNFTLSGANVIALAGAAAPVAGTDYGQIAFGGTTLTNGGDLTLTVSGTVVDGATYDLINYASGASAGGFSTVSIGGSYSATLTNNSGTWSGVSGGFLFTFSEGNGDLSIATSVPEPSTVAVLLGLASLGFVAVRRRRA